MIGASVVNECIAVLSAVRDSGFLTRPEQEAVKIAVSELERCERLMSSRFVAADLWQHRVVLSNTEPEREGGPNG